MNTRLAKKQAISLIELIVVVVILGVLAAMAIPRFSQGADGGESELRTALAVLRSSIELYCHDHRAYPGQKPAGTDAEARTVAACIRQLTRYTDADGRVSEAPSEAFCYGPYLRRGVPLCPVSPRGPSAEIHLISGSQVPAYTAIADHAGWVYNCDTGYIAANSPAVDARGARYDSY